ncbi:MAG: hypothetical protein U1F07_05860 [Rubrivivax sp.]
MKSLWPACAALALIAVPAAADSGTATSTEVSALRREIDRLRTDYEARLNALEQRLLAVQNAAAAPPAPAPPAPAPAGAGANAFNPALSLIVSGRYGRTSLDPARYAIGGFMLPPQAEIGPGTRGLSLAESELGIAASIDPWWAGAAHIALHPDDSLSIEEAYVQTTALGNGLTLKGGRFFSGVGYLNAQHAHAWDFVDAPLAYQAMLGGQYGDDGLQLRWLAPTDLFAEFGAEIGRGRSFPGTDTARNGVGMAALTVHLGGDFGTSQSWRAGVSLLRARAQEQELATRDRTGAAVTNGFSGTTRVWIADAVWKWAPDGNAARRNFKLQAEWLQSRREGTLIYALEQADVAGAYRALQSGWYLQGVWQFMPRWRAGLRTERLDPGEPDYGINAGAFAAAPWRPRKASAMLDYSASEFSRLRLQFADDRARPGLGADRQVFLQYQMSLGAHGAHGF